MEEQQAQQQQQQDSDEAAPPPLLAALQRLDDAAWRSVLWPLLRDNRLRSRGSTSSLAATCRQLRQLCQSTTTDLSFIGGASVREGALALVPERFPACTSAGVSIDSSDGDVTKAAPALLLALARLPRLSEVWLQVNTSSPDCNNCIGFMLRAVRQQLPRVHFLSLVAGGGWADDGSAWRELSSMVQLTRLNMSWYLWAEEGEEEVTGSLQHLTALSALTQLQSLLVANRCFLTGPQPHGYLASLGALTQLEMLGLVSADGLGAIGACTNLRHLELAADELDVQLDDAACAGLQRLVQLTRLDVSTAGTDSPAFASALACMRQLEQLGVPATTHTTLAALAGLSRLTWLQSKWTRGEAAAATGAQRAAVAVCASVRAVDLGGAGIPWRAFPGATSITQHTSWAPADFVAISSHCRQLVALDTGLIHIFWTTGSMMASAPVAERAAAIRSLVALTALTALVWCANDNAELGALAELSSLRRLEVTCDGSECTLMVVQMLAAARQLSAVRLDVGRLRPTSADAMALLASFRHLQELTIFASSQHRDVFEAGLADARAAGMGVPANVLF